MPGKSAWPERQSAQILFCVSDVDDQSVTAKPPLLFVSPSSVRRRCEGTVVATNVILVAAIVLQRRWKRVLFMQ